MAAGQYQKIEPGDYNSIRNKIAGILGSGSGQSGYGQTVSSSEVAQGDVIRLSQWLNLRTDLRLARQHQTGNDEGGNLTLPTNSLLISEALRSQYATFAQTVEDNKFAIGAGQYSTENIISYSKSGSWNATIENVVTVSFTSAAQARYYFNAGGSLTVSASRAGGSAGSKDDTWATMLSDVGTIAMNYTTTTASSGTTYGIGFYDLTTTNQLILYKPAPSGNYAENDFWVYARCDVGDNSSGGATQVIFTIRFQDDDTGDQQGGYLPGPAVDEYVNTVSGSTLNTSVGMYRPSGSNVSITGPTASQTGM